MVSAISLCLLALSLTAVSSQLLSSDPESTDAPISERRTFKHGKPVKILPLAKKHKKFALVPHVFGKGHYQVPIVHEVSKPFYKVHRYHGIEVKPAHDISFSTPEPYIESHSLEPPSGDFSHSFGSDHSFSSPSFSDHSYSAPSFSDHSFPAPSFSDHSFSAPSFSDHSSISFPSPSPAPIFAPLPPSPPKQIFSFAPAPQQVFQSFPIAPPAFSPISIPRPAIHSVPAPAPVFTSIPSQPLPPPQPIISVIPIKIQTPVLPAPSPAPVFQPVPIKIHHPAPALPSLPAPTPAPALPALPAPSPTPIVVKIPSPVFPALPTPAPVLPSLPVVSATPAPVFHPIPVSLPPPQFSIPAPAPSLPTFPAFPSLPASVAPEPEFPYPPSGTPIPSHIKDISLGDIDIKGSPLPTIEPPKFEEVTPVIDDGSKNLDPGFFQKLKGWKADKANAALSHFTHFMQKPIIQPALSIAHAPNKVPVELPVHPTVQFPGPVSPLPLAPASIFPIFPPAQFFSPAKYENFPPNNIESPPLLNSYGVPIPHDTYAPPHISHERLSSAASEEEPAVVPAPENKEQNLQRPQQQKFQPQAIPHDHPVYIAEENKTVKDDNKTIEDIQEETNEYKAPEPNTDEITSVAHNYPNHKE